MVRVDSSNFDRKVADKVLESANDGFYELGHRAGPKHKYITDDKSLIFVAAITLYFTQALPFQLA